MTRRVAVIKDKGAFMFCREAIGGVYYHAIARITDEASARKLIKGPQDERIIVRFSDSLWVVTTKEEGIKEAWAACHTLTAAESML